MGVKVSYDRLGALYTNLLAISSEFDEAASRRSDLQSDVDRPYGRSELRDLAGDFESQWDDRRNKLNEGLKKVSEHTKAILDGFGDFDTEAAAEIAQAMQDGA
ncbi:MAG: flagellar protein FlgN [Actinomycetota bacterium]